MNGDQKSPAYISELSPATSNDRTITETYVQNVLALPPSVSQSPPERGDRFSAAETTEYGRRIMERAREYGFNPDLLLRIAVCESGLVQKWNYRHDEDPQKYTAYGLFQIIASHEKTYGISRMTPEGNIDIAILLYRDQGTSPWTASKNCWE